MTWVLMMCSLGCSYYSAFSRIETRGVGESFPKSTNTSKAQSEPELMGGIQGGCSNYVKQTTSLSIYNTRSSGFFFVPQAVVFLLLLIFFCLFVGKILPTRIYESSKANLFNLAKNRIAILASSSRPENAEFF